MSRRRWLLVAATVLFVLLLADFCRVQISLTRAVRSARLGQSVEATKRLLGKPDLEDRWSGSYGSGALLEYWSPYAWEPLLAFSYALLSVRIGKGGPYWSMPSGWYANYSPAVHIVFDDAGRLVEVDRKGFISKDMEVVKAAP